MELRWLFGKTDLVNPEIVEQLKLKIYVAEPSGVDGDQSLILRLVNSMRARGAQRGKDYLIHVGQHHVALLASPLYLSYEEDVLEMQR